MPTKVKKELMFREFVYKDISVRRENILKYYKPTKAALCKENKITGAQLDFMVWCYDLEFFTRAYAAEKLKMNTRNIYTRMVHPLLGKELLYRYHHRFDVYKRFEDAMFHEEGGHRYRVRYALSKRGVMIVERFYFLLSKLE
jgi:hypothetical protein